MTLRFDAQRGSAEPPSQSLLPPLTPLADQISMHLFASLLLYNSLAGLLPRSGLLPRFRMGVGLAIALVELITIHFFLVRNATGLHQSSFAALCTLITVVLTYRIESLEYGGAKVMLRRILAAGILSFLMGYTLWHLDFRACSILRHLRHKMGVPLGLLLEFHGWWHFLTGLSGAAYIECIHLLYSRDICQGEVASGKAEHSWENISPV